MAAAQIDNVKPLEQNKDDEENTEKDCIPEDQTPILQKLKNDLRTVIEKLNEVCMVNSAMLQKINDLVEENNDLSDQVYYQKIEITELNQYGRRENVEFCRIPESIEQKDLENHIITVMDSIGVKITKNNIVAVHRIGKKNRSRPRNVIVRFVNRKHSFTLLKNKKKLNSGKFKNYYIIENLCPYNKKIFNTLYKSKMNDEIHSVWSFNGQVYAKVGENDDPTHIKHMDEIDDLFEDSLYEVADENDVEHDSPSTEDNNQSKNDGGFGKGGGNEGDFGKLGFGSTPRSSLKSHSKRRLSDIAEESPILRTPIAPLIIKI